MKTVTKKQVNKIIDNAKVEVFHRVFDKQCIVVALLENGFTIVGESACVDPKNYDEEVGFNLAVKNIEQKIWELEGYLLQNKGQSKELIANIKVDKDEIVKEVLKSIRKEEEIIYDTEKAIDYISNNITGLFGDTKAIIRKVLALEENYMKSIGIIEG